MTYRYRPILWGLLFASCSTVAQTEFPTQQELREYRQQAPGHEREVSKLVERLGGVGENYFPMRTASEITIVPRRISTDDTMLREYADPIRPMWGIDKTAVVPFPVAGTRLAKCHLVSQSLSGTIHDNTYSGLTRLFQCGGKPLLLVTENAQNWGRSLAMRSKEQVNTSVKIRGKSRGAILWRFRSAQTGNGQSMLMWRDGDKLVEMRVNSVDDSAVQWMHTVAQTL